MHTCPVKGLARERLQHSVMSESQLQLASLILREFYGELCEKVGIYLIKKGNMPLGAVIQDTGLKKDQVQRALAVLIQQNMVAFEVHKRGFVEYGMDINHVLLRTRFPQYIYTAKMLYGDAAELLVEEMLQHGQTCVASIVEKVASRMNIGHPEMVVNEADVRSKFVELVETHFIQRCPDVTSQTDSKKPAVPSFRLKDEDIYKVPDMEVEEAIRKRKRSFCNDDEPPSKRQKWEDTSSTQGNITQWRINQDRFHHYMRDQCIINAVTKRMDKKAGEVVRTILRISEVKSDPNHPVTTPISAHEIVQAIPKELGLNKQTVDQYLNLLTEDSMAFVVKAGDSGGGMFAIHIKKALTALCTAHIESVIQERFGSKSLRLFKLLLMKKHLEQKQIEEFAMVPAKEAKEILYRMFGEHFISMTEVPKTPDHAPSRTFYLFSVNIDQIARSLLHKCYKAMANLVLRREYETKENKRLLDKQQRVEAIAASLEQSGADPAQREEIEEMISQHERAQLTKVKYMTNKLEQSELQLDDTIFVLQTYLIYSRITT